MSTKYTPEVMTEVSRDAIVDPLVALMICNSDTNKINYFDGSAWVEIGGSLFKETVIIRKPEGTPDTEELHLYHDGTFSVIESKTAHMAFVASGTYRFYDATHLDADYLKLAVSSTEITLEGFGPGFPMVTLRAANNKVKMRGNDFSPDSVDEITLGASGGFDWNGLFSHGKLDVSLTSDVIGQSIKANASQTADLLQLLDSSGNFLSGFDKNGHFLTQKTTAPADGDLATSELALWLDDSTGAAKLMIKVKDDAGTVMTGSVALT